MNKYAVVFPGQGSQSVGMLMDIMPHFPEIQEIFDQAAAVLGYDLGQLIQQGPAEVLNQTEYTQPAILTASYALWRIFQAKKAKNSLKIDYMAGHSLGEYTALVCAKSLDFKDALRIVAARGQYMQEAVTGIEAAMAAIIGLEDQQVAAICEKVRQTAAEVIAPANFNSVGQVVISGHRAPIERAMVLAKEQGATMAIRIPVSVASHCQLMQPASAKLQSLLASVYLAPPCLPIINNVDVTIHQDAEAIRSALVRQLYSPVRWVETVQYFLKVGVTHVIECGPGKVLTGLNKRINKSLHLSSTGDWASMQALLREDSLQ